MMPPQTLHSGRPSTGSGLALWKKLERQLYWLRLLNPPISTLRLFNPALTLGSDQCGWHQQIAFALQLLVY